MKILESFLFCYRADEAAAGTNSAISLFSYLLECAKGEKSQTLLQMLKTRKLSLNQT